MSRGRQPQPAALPKLFSGTPLLLCSCCCTCREGCTLLLAGTMDGSVLLLDTNSGDLLQQMRPHRRYCVSVAWSPDGQHFASAAWDDTVGIHLCTGSCIRGSQAPSQPQVEQRGSVQEGSESPEAQMQTLASIPYTQHVNCVVFLPGGRQIAAAVKESVYLRLIDMDTMKVTLMHPCCCNSALTCCTHTAALWQVCSGSWTLLSCWCACPTACLMPLSQEKCIGTKEFLGLSCCT